MRISILYMIVALVYATTAIPSAAMPAQTPVPSAMPTASPNPAAVSIAVPGGTPISVSLSEPLTSGSANVGDIDAVIVTKEVDIGGYVIIAKGSAGQATVTSVERAGGNGHGGKLAINLDWIHSVDGGKIALSTVNHASDDGDQKGAASTATIATYLLLGPLGLFAHNFVHGKDVTLDTDKVFNVFIDHDIHVTSDQKSTAPTGFDQ